MDYSEYVHLSQKIASLVKRTKYKKAMAALESLLASDISDLDKSMHCLNMAVVYEKQDKVEQALECYDRGIAYESRHSRFFVAEKKAVYLAQQGRRQDSLRLYEALLRKPYLTEGDKERLRKNIQKLRST